MVPFLSRPRAIRGDRAVDQRKVQQLRQPFGLLLQAIPVAVGHQDKSRALDTAKDRVEFVGRISTIRSEWITSSLTR